MKEALLYKKLKNGTVQCNLCHHHCLIPEGQRGVCGVRQNQKGKLYSLVYNKAMAINVDPIEKKPLFHFLPGSYALSFGTLGCNFGCLFCQNWDISQPPRQKNFPLKSFAALPNVSPQSIVKEAIQQKVASIAYTYNEPTIFLEYALDTMQLAHRLGLKNIWVSNGYMSPEALKLITPYLDAINIDLKSFREEFYGRICGARLKPVLENIKRVKKSNVWLELTTLLIPGENDSLKEIEAIANFITTEVGQNTPWHISKFYPAYKMSQVPPTSENLIEKAVKIGKRAGLKYVYAGNLPGNAHENTYCPHCNALVIERRGYIVRRYDKNGRCPNCGSKLDLILK